MKTAAGLGFKPEYFDEAMTCPAAGLWFEIHAENYMIDGGPRLAMLQALRRDHEISVHGVGLSLAADADPDPRHLSKLAQVIERAEPFLVSEHLAWSAWQGVYHPDLLPFPRTRASLQRIARNIDITQSRLRRRILIENPAAYLPLPHEISEADFLRELVRSTGCGLLLDVNNAYISAHNLGGDAASYIAALPAADIGEIHLAGHAPDVREDTGLLIDTHGSPIAEPVWNLYRSTLRHTGAAPTLIERDDNLPPFDELLRERGRAAALLDEILQVDEPEWPHVSAG